MLLLCALRATNTAGEDYLPVNGDPIVCEALGRFNQTTAASGTGSPAAVSVSASQDSTIELNGTNLTATGTLQVQASGTGNSDPVNGGWAATDRSATRKLTFAIIQPMDAILEVSTGNSSNDARQIPDAHLFRNFLRLSGSGTPPLDVGAGDFELQQNSFHASSSLQTTLRLEPAADSGSGVFHLNVEQEEFRNLGIDLEEGPFAYSRTATFKLTVQPLVPLPEFNSFTVTPPVPARASGTWTFSASIPSELAGLAVQVECSPTGDDGSWSPLPGDDIMKRACAIR